VCNKSMSERTKRTMRRLLALFRMKISCETLRARFTIAKHTTTESDRGDRELREA
jgi:hypothetical protein